MRENTLLCDTVAQLVRKDKGWAKRTRLENPVGIIIKTEQVERRALAEFGR